MIAATRARRQGPRGEAERGGDTPTALPSPKPTLLGRRALQGLSRPRRGHHPRSPFPGPPLSIPAAPHSPDAQRGPAAELPAPRLRLRLLRRRRLLRPEVGPRLSEARPRSWRRRGGRAGPCGAARPCRWPPEHPPHQPLSQHPPGMLRNVPGGCCGRGGCECSAARLGVRVINLMTKN